MAQAHFFLCFFSAFPHVFLLARVVFAHLGLLFCVVPAGRFVRDGGLFFLPTVFGGRLTLMCGRLFFELPAFFGAGGVL